MKDLDEREPCQTYPSHELNSAGSEQKSFKVPMTTRSTHSLALTNLKKHVSQDLKMMSPVHLEETLNSQ